MWHIGDGRKVRFWKDVWFVTCSLVIQYWNIYSIINDQGKAVRDAWDGESLLQLCGASLFPPRLHVFLWLFANNKVLTIDNLAKMRQVDDKTYLFCAEL
jgi:hypothetical protein